MQFLRMLRAQWDFVVGRFAASRIESPDELAAAERVLRAVRGDELHRIVDGDPWASPAFAGVRIPYRAYGVRDGRTGEMVGVLQASDASALMSLPGTVHAYALDRIDPALLDRTMVGVFFAILPAYRKTAAGVALLAETCRAESVRGSRMAVFVAEPPLLARYLQMGARPLAPMRASAYGGYRIPLYALTGDRRHLEAVGSPLRYGLKDIPADDAPEFLAWHARFVAEHGEIGTGVLTYSDLAGDEHPCHHALTRDLGDAQIARLLEGSLLLQSAAGDRILAAGDGGRVLAVVESGAVQVEIQGNPVALLGAGEPLGEIAFATGAPRTADLIAVSDETRILQFSPAAIARLPPDAAMILWRNVAWCLAQRLAQTTSRLRVG